MDAKPPSLDQNHWTTCKHDSTTIIHMILCIIIAYCSEGNLPDIKASGSLHEFLLDIHDRYGPMASWMFGPQLVVSISCPDLYKQYLKVFDRPPCLFQLFEPLITEHSIQYANGAAGRMRHAAYLRMFSDGVLKNYYQMLQKVL